MKRIKKHIGVHHISSPQALVLVLSVLIAGWFCFDYSFYGYQKFFKAEISTEKTKDIDFAEPVVLYFSQPMQISKFEGNFELYPASNFDLKWTNGNRKLSIIPKSQWLAETNYTISVPAGIDAMFVRSFFPKVTFSTKKFPRAAKITPKNGASDVFLSLEDPIVVDFDKSVDGFFVKFSFDPYADMVYQINQEKTQFKLLPQSYLADNTLYTFKISIKKYGDPDENYREIYSGNFKTAPPLNIVWEKDFKLRLEQARQYTRAKIVSGKYIDVNLATQIMSTFQDGRLLSSYLISSGKRGMETPKGQHQIYNKTPRAWSKEYGLYMPYWMAIVSDGKVGIHELPEWPGGYKEGASHLGTPVSHGCMRLGVGAAREVYNWADIGTPVIVY